MLNNISDSSLVSGEGGLILIHHALGFRHTRIIYAKSDVSLVALQSHDDDEGDDAWEDDDGTLLVLAFTCD